MPPQSAIKPREFETYTESLAIWAKEASVVFSDTFGTNWMVYVIAGVIVFLFRRHRLYATLAISYTMLFPLLHLVVDAEYEIPLEYSVTKASAHDSPHLLKHVSSLKVCHLELVERGLYLNADNAYIWCGIGMDLWNEYTIRPIIDIRTTS